MNNRNDFQIFDQCQLEQNLISDDSRGLELWGHLAAIFALGEVEEGGLRWWCWGSALRGVCVCTASGV